jgi:hypothetical protein
MNFLDKIKAVHTGQLRAIEEPLYTIKLDINEVPRYRSRFAREYAITVTLGTTRWIEEEVIQASGGKVIDHAVEDMKYDIVRELYGELRKDLYVLQSNLRNELNYRASPFLKELSEIISKLQC